MESAHPVSMLKQSLEHICLLSEEAVALADRQQKALIQGDHQTVMNTALSQQEKIECLGRAEAECHRAAACLKAALGCSPETPLSALTARLPAPVAASIESLGERLKAAYLSWHRLADVNRRLAKDALEYVGFALDCLQGMAQKGRLYRPDGHAVEVREEMGFLDMKA
ncbi:MAG: flagellar protein FlgN [Armatimonadetes bacterium]|nr:flagellar protein FlgN [Armatimonadota bacterium]